MASEDMTESQIGFQLCRPEVQGDRSHGNRDVVKANEGQTCTGQEFQTSGLWEGNTIPRLMESNNWNGTQGSKDQNVAEESEGIRVWRVKPDCSRGEEQPGLY